MPILVDYSQVSMASVFVAQKEFGTNRVDESMIRHMILNSLLSIRKRFFKDYGELVICCDSTNVWRKEYFPYYKFKRQESKAESATDWAQVFEFMRVIREELESEFPYKVVKVDRCEGDDVIASIVKYHQTEELQQIGLDEVEQPCLIISTDKDFGQLQVFKGVRQFNPRTQDFIKVPDPELHLKMLIIKGDSGDGVPNVLSQDDCFVLGVRQKPMTEKRVNAVMESIAEGDMSDELARNIDRNSRLVNLIEGIPPEIHEEIIDAYKSAPTPSRSKLLSYFIKHRLQNLSNQLSHF